MCKMVAIKSHGEYQARHTPKWEEKKLAYALARNAYTAALRKAKSLHWKNWLEKADEKSIWVVGKFSKNPLSDGGRACIPTLSMKDHNGQTIKEVLTDEDKAKNFINIFFPSRPPSLPALADDSSPPPEPLKFSMPAPHQVKNHINKIKLQSAPDPNGIPNIVLKQCAEILVPLLLCCIKGIINIGNFPRAWRSWKTVVLCKIACPNYTIPKAYRPIALYNTMGKVISGVMTDITVFLTVCHNLLPSWHFSGLPGKMTSDSLLYLMHHVKNASCARKVATIVFLDIVNAFPNAVMERLLRNMVKLGYPSEIVNFLTAMLNKRTTTLSFNDFMSHDINIDNGITQEETASMYDPLSNLQLWANKYTAGTQ